MLDWSRFKTGPVGPGKAFEAFTAQLFERWLRGKYASDLTAYVLHGAGGDGGVEAYATLSSGDIVGLQAKWFRGNLDDPRVRQIRGSLDTAIKSYPSLRRYIVALPRNLTKGKQGKYGKVRKGGVERWTEFIADVANKHPKLEIIRWDEAGSLEQLACPGNQEIKALWFDGELTFEAVETAWSKTKSRLDARYLPHLHAKGQIDATLAEDLWSQARIQQARKEMEEIHSQLAAALSDLKGFTYLTEGRRPPEIDAATSAAGTTISSLQRHAELLDEVLSVGPRRQISNCPPADALWELSTRLDTFKKSDEGTFTADHAERSLSTAKSALAAICRIDTWVRDSAGPRVLRGPAGCGKTHASAAAVAGLVRQRAPAVMILAKDHNPALGAGRMLRETLDLPGWSLRRMLDGLEALAILDQIRHEKREEGEAGFSRCLLLIDGLEESTDSLRWVDVLSDLGVELSHRLRVHLAVIARPEYFQQVHLPAEWSAVQIEEDGDIDLPALFHAYTDSFDVTVDQVPWLAWVPRTPLEIRLFAEEFTGRSVSAAEGANANLLTLFRHKLKRLEEEARRRAGATIWSTDLNLVHTVLAVLSRLISKSSTSRVPDLEVIQAARAVDPEFTPERIRGALSLLCEYGLVDRWSPPTHDLRSPQPEYDLSTRHLADFVLASELAEATLASIKQEGPVTFPPVLRRRNAATVLYAANLADQGHFVAGVPWDTPREELPLLHAEALALIPPDKTGARAAEITGWLTKSTTLNRGLLRRLTVRVSRIPNHPLGPRLLDQALRGLPLAQRDPIWSVPEDLDGTGPWRQCFEPILDDFELSPRVDRWDGLPLVAAWSCSSVVEDRRRRAREMLAVWGASRLADMVQLLAHMSNVDDPQIVDDVVISALGAAIGASFDDPALKDLGNTSSFSYDAAGNLIGQTNELGTTASYSYNARRQPLTHTDPLGNVRSRVYDAAGNLVAMTDGLGKTTTFAYDAAGNLLTVTDAGGHTTMIEYDAFGNVTKEISPLGAEVTFTHDASGKTLSEARARTQDGVTETLTWTFDYDRLGRPLELTYPDGSTSRLVYDPLGKVTEEIDRLGRTTRHAYDGLGNELVNTYPDGTTEQFFYDAEGQRVAFTNRAGETTRFSYDPLGRLIGILNPDGSSASMTYDGAGRVVAVTDELGHTQSSEYDAAGQQTRSIDALGNATVFAYNANGNLIAETDPAGRTRTFTHDAEDRLLRVGYPDGVKEIMTYDDLDRLTSFTDTAGATTRFAYDAMDRLVQVTDALDQVTHYAYDELNKLVSQTDAAGRVTGFAYDRQGRLTRRTLPTGGMEGLVYDPVGNLISKTDFLGGTTAFVYDVDDRVIERAAPDGSRVSFTYTPSGRRATMTDSRGTTAYGYDAKDRLVSVTEPGGNRLSFAYDPRGNRTASTVTVGAVTLTTSYAHDALNRLSTVTDPQAGVYTFTYDANGNRATARFPNGTQTTYAYDSRNRLTGLSTLGPEGGVIQSYAYTYDPAGNRTRIEEHDGRVTTAAYDDLYRLIEETVTDASGLLSSKTFTYDAVGNRLAQETTTVGGGTTSIAYTYDDRDRLLTETGRAYTWDANGNLLSRTGAGGGTYRWDSKNRLTGFIAAGGTAVAHAYDGDGNRVRTQVTPPGGAPQEINYQIDPSGPLTQVVTETDAAGALLAYHVRGDDLLRVDRSSESRFFHMDGLGSVRHLTDPSAAVTNSYVYSAFGELEGQSGADANDNLFAGEGFEAESGLYDLRARWMDPRVGRFLSMDPFPGDRMDPLSLHRYLYVSGNPLNRTDPSGLFGFGGLVATLGAIAAIVVGLTGVVHYFFTPADYRGHIVFRRVQPIVIDSRWSDIEVYSNMLRARETFFQASMILNFGDIIRQDPVEGAAIHSWNLEEAGKAWSTRGTIPVLFGGYVERNSSVPGVSINFPGKHFMPSRFEWRASSVTVLGKEKIHALSHELGHSIGDLDDRDLPKLFSKWLMSNEVTAWHGDELDNEEIDKLRIFGWWIP